MWCLVAASETHSSLCIDTAPPSVYKWRVCYLKAYLSLPQCRQFQLLHPAFSVNCGRASGRAAACARCLSAASEFCVSMQTEALPSMKLLPMLSFLSCAGLLCSCVLSSVGVSPAYWRFASSGLWGARGGASRWPVTVVVTGQRRHHVRTANQGLSAKVGVIHSLLV